MLSVTYVVRYDRSLTLLTGVCVRLVAVRIRRGGDRLKNSVQLVHRDLLRFTVRSPKYTPKAWAHPSPILA